VGGSGSDWSEADELQAAQWASRTSCNLVPLPLTHPPTGTDKEGSHDRDGALRLDKNAPSLDSNARHHHKTHSTNMTDCSHETHSQSEREADVLLPTYTHRVLTDEEGGDRGGVGNKRRWLVVT